jgi:NADH-quinone oxidoreductase subunit L
MTLFLECLVLFAPLAASALIFFLGLKGRGVVSLISLFAVGIALLASLSLFWLHPDIKTALEVNRPWLSFGTLSVFSFGFVLDRLSLLMMLVVSGVCFCIFVYSVEYMKADEGFARFFACLLFFVFSMNGILLANNFLMLYIFWELVAVSSYLLIGFWQERPEASAAANKAFYVNRLADLGFLIGILMLWFLSGRGAAGESTLLFSDLARQLPALLQSGLIRPEEITFACLLIFCGVIGKSAQFPLHIWLPDAMEGPTPVSALIHAATMVAAGIYLLSHTFFLFSLSLPALSVIAWVGVITLLAGGLLACVQNDIKKILAYSTISQLGYMVLALGLGSATSDMYHLITHAFFKALLFLSAGVLIHAVHTQDIWQMGGLWRKVPAASLTFLIGTVALCGIPPFSGFFSKDEILLLAYRHHRLLYWLALLGTIISAFYMTRTWWIAVMGRDRHPEIRAPKTSWILFIPLGVLSVFSVLLGFAGIPEFLSDGYLSEADLSIPVAMASLVAVFLGIGIGTFFYAKTSRPEEPLKQRLGILYRVLENKLYLDDLFLWLADLFRKKLAKLFDLTDQRVLIARMVNTTASLCAACGTQLRKIQTGAVQIDQAGLAAGMLLVTVLMLAFVIK